MPSKGQILKDNFTGDTIEFIETSSDTNAERVTLKVKLKSKGQTVDDHIHILQEESYKVLSGTLTYLSDGQQNHISAGEEVTLPKNKPHNHYNTSDEPAEFIQTITPGIDIDFFIENLFGMINDGKVKDGKLPFLQAMVTAKYLESPSRLAAIPMGLQNVLINTIGPLARIFGYRAIYKKYTGVEK
ncbi:MAG TPA: cupin domain-containing protein [Lunatimonas sp.]|nr:cupin domain-containing protein [Lunatimonas sp.]